MKRIILYDYGYDYGYDMISKNQLTIRAAGIPTIKQLIEYGLNKKEARKTYRTRKKHI